MAQVFKPPSTQRVYDVCVIGSQLGGVAAGALLARRGYRVVHVDHDNLGGSYEDGGYQLPYAPAVLPSPRAFPAAEAVLGELALTTDLSRQLEPCSPDVQILLPRHRLDLSRDPAARARELDREWPAAARQLEEILEKLQQHFEAATPFLKGLPPLPPAGLLERYALAKALKAAAAPGGPGPIDRASPFDGSDAQPLVRALLSLHRFLTYRDGPPSPLSTTRLLGAALRGTYRLPGGRETLREILRRRIADSRGDLVGTEEQPAVAESLELDGRRVAAARITGSSDTFVARAFLVGTDAPAVRRLLPEGRAGRMGALLDRMRPVRQLFVVNWVVPASALPPALGETFLALRDPAGAGPLGAILGQVLPARRARRKGSAEPASEERVLSASAFAPATTREAGEEGIRDLAGRLRQALAESLPFFDRRLVHESIPLLAVPPRGRGSRLSAHPLYDVRLPGALGVTGLPVRSPLRNLFFAGREVVPGLGIEGEFHAALQAAAAVQALLGKKDLLR